MEVEMWRLVLFLAMIINSHALRVTNLDLPHMALQGDTVELSCAFTLADTAGGGPGPATLVRRQATGQTLVARSSSSLELKRVSGRDWKRDKEAAVVRTERGVQQSGEQLYAIKWYKDEREFYRYLAQEWPHKQALPMEGVQVDVSVGGEGEERLTIGSL